MNSERNFDNWLAMFKSSIADYDYYVDFEKAEYKATEHKAEISLLNELVGSENIEQDFLDLAHRHPEVLQAIPALLAIRRNSVLVYDDGELKDYEFTQGENTPEDYLVFMRETGLFDLMESGIIQNLFDYLVGIEVGLDSNARKNRGGHLMEDLVESFLIDMGFERKDTKLVKPNSPEASENNVYYKEMTARQIEKYWNIDLSTLTNKGTTTKRFDFVVRTNNKVYAIETNFYASSGSKLNETSRSYKTLALEAKGIPGFEFIWITDGIGWIYAANNLRETFDVMDHVYNIAELENGALQVLFAEEE